MNKRVGFGYLASSVFPVISVAVLMLRAFSPHTRLVALALYLVGCVCLVLAVRNHARVRRNLSQAKDRVYRALVDLGLLRKRALLSGVVFTSVLVLFPVLLPVEDVYMLKASVSDLEREIESDYSRLSVTREQLVTAKRELNTAVDKLDLVDGTSRNRLRAAWASYLDYALELDRIVDRHKHFYQLAPRSPRLADRSFLLGYSALTTQLDHGLDVAAAVGNRQHIESLLDEASAEHGLPAHTYLLFRKALARTDNVLRLQAGRTYLSLLERAGRFETNEERALCGADHAAGTDTLRRLGKDPSVMLDSPLDLFEEKAFVAWFPMQKGAAVSISPLRVHHRENFIDGADLAQAHGLLRAGDILLERRNWYLTNLGIPGFWPHAALYTGSLEELDSEFPNAPRVLGGLRPSEYLKRHAPTAYAAMKDDRGDQPPRIIEAVGAGVIVQPLEVSGQADYMAALRPRLDDDARVKAVLRAFIYFGRPYDYDFDFATDETVVCSELVYKALAPHGDDAGIRFDLATQNGRFLLPPNDIAKSFDQNFGTEHAQLDFVFFLDGSEADGAAHHRDATALRESWRRPKWDVAQP